MSEKVKRRLAAKEARRQAKIQAAFDRACDRAGVTWEQIITCLDDCGCCFTGLPEDANDHRALMVYWDYRYWKKSITI